MLGARCRDGEWLALPHLSPRLADLRRAAERVRAAEGPRARVRALEMLAIAAEELLLDTAWMEEIDAEEG